MSHLQEMVPRTLFLPIELRESPRKASLWANETFFILCVYVRFKIWYLIFLLDGILLLNLNQIMLYTFVSQFLSMTYRSIPLESP